MLLNLQLSPRESDGKQQTLADLVDRSSDVHTHSDLKPTRLAFASACRERVSNASLLIISALLSDQWRALSECRSFTYAARALDEVPECGDSGGKINMHSQASKNTLLVGG